MTTRRQQTTGRKRGRPPGSKTQTPAVVTVSASRCPKCGSTDRGPYTRTIEHAHAGFDREGDPCTHVVRRWTRCAACGQTRIDRFYENRASVRTPETGDGGLRRAA